MHNPNVSLSPRTKDKNQLLFRFLLILNLGLLLTASSFS